MDGTLVLTDLLKVLEGLSVILVVLVTQQHVRCSVALLAGETILGLSSLGTHLSL